MALLSLLGSLQALSDMGVIEVGQTREMDLVHDQERDSTTIYDEYDQ